MCTSCVAALEGWGEALRCTLCQREVTHEDGLDANGVCGACLQHPQALDRMGSYGPYRGALRQLIHLLKYDGMRPLGRLLGERCAASGDWLGETDMIVPAPLHWTRRWERGFNQSLLLAQEVSRRQGLPCVPRALQRRRATPPQAGLSGRQRRESLRGAFRARRDLVEGKRVLLVDDVVTTGATLESCARALRRAGAVSVKALTAARAELGQRAI